MPLTLFLDVNKDWKNKHSEGREKEKKIQSVLDKTEARRNTNENF